MSTLSLPASVAGLRAAAAVARPAPRPIAVSPVAAAPMPSDQLLQGRKAVEISHNGSVYRLQAEGAKQPQPDLHIRGDRDVRYERVAQAMAAAQQAGLKKIGFVTEPKPAP